MSVDFVFVVYFFVCTRSYIADLGQLFSHSTQHLDATVFIRR